MSSERTGPWSGARNGAHTLDSALVSACEHGHHGDTDGTVRVKVDAEERLRVLDLDTGEELGALEAGEVLEVNLDGTRGKVLHLRP